MTVRQLIDELLDLPMDTEILISEQREDLDYNWGTRKANCVVDYEDGTVGIISNGERLRSKMEERGI